jgi:hypothetical protein
MPRRSIVRPSLHRLALVASFAIGASVILDGWWDRGHFLTGQAAAEALPADMPAFFRAAVDQLSYLNYEPDRWKDSAERTADPALTGASSPEHYLDFEQVPPGTLELPNRFDFALALGRRKVSAGEVGVLPYRTLELFQQVRVNFRLWRAAKDDRTRGWIEQRIIDDAGVLGHYVGDGANPLHTTINHNGWVQKNPHKFTTDKTLHGRFEGKFVEARITIDDVRPRVAPAAKAIIVTQPRREIVKFLTESHSHVEELYRLEAREPFSEKTMSAEHKTFVVDRLAAGATFLRDLWWTAWITSAPEAASTTPSR